MFVMASRKFNKINKDFDRHTYFNVIDPFMVEQNKSYVWKNSFFFHFFFLHIPRALVQDKYLVISSSSAKVRIISYIKTL